MNEAIAHLNQLIALGCDYAQALAETSVAFDISADDIQAAYDVQFNY